MIQKITILRPFAYLVIGFVSVTSFSCRSNKDLTILRDASINEKLKSYPEPSSQYAIKSNDNLFVSIISSNKEMNEVYNPSISGTGKTAVNNVYNDVSGQFIFGYVVDNNGDVTLPLIGKVSVKGLTFSEAEAAVGAKAKEFLKDFTVKIRLMNFRITVMGEVTKPGVYYNYNNVFTVMDAISIANGITNYADLEKVLVLRPSPQGNQSFYLNLSKKESLQSPAYYLQPNDLVFIEPSKYKNVQLRTPVYSIAISSVAAVLLLISILDK